MNFAQLLTQASNANKAPEKHDHIAYLVSNRVPGYRKMLKNGFTSQTVKEKAKVCKMRASVICNELYKYGYVERIGKEIKGMSWSYIYRWKESNDSKK